MCRKACVKEPSRRNYDTERTAYKWEEKNLRYLEKGLLNSRKPDNPNASRKPDNPNATVAEKTW